MEVARIDNGVNKSCGWALMRCQLGKLAANSRLDGALARWPEVGPTRGYYHSEMGTRHNILCNGTQEKCGM